MTHRDSALNTGRMEALGQFKFLFWLSCIPFATVAIMWVIPDRRILDELKADHHSDDH